MAEWGQTEELLASIVDVLVAANSKKGARSWTYPRPGVEPEGVRSIKPKKTRTPEELRAVLAEKWARGDEEAKEVSS